VNFTALASAATANFVEHATRTVSSHPGADVAVTSDLVVSDSGLEIDTFNIVCAAKLGEGGVGVAVRRVRAQFGSRAFSWWVAPGDLPANLGVRLEAEGLPPSESCLAMFADVVVGELPPIAEGVRIRRVRTPDQMASYAAISAANWAPPDRILEGLYRSSAPALLETGSPLRFYVAERSGAPVAGVEIVLAAGVAGVYGLSTLRELRRQGIGTSILAGALADSLAPSGGRVVLQAAAEGVGLYRRLGFAEFGSIVEHKPRP